MPLINGIGPGELIIVGILAMPLVVLIVVAWAILRRDRSAGSWAPPPDPRAILADRLARGEATPEAFGTAMKALGYGGPDTPS